MATRTDHGRRRDEIERRSRSLRGVMVSGALLASLTLTGGFAVHPPEVASVSSSGPDAGIRTEGWDGRVTTLVRPSGAAQSHATTQGS